MKLNKCIWALMSVLSVSGIAHADVTLDKIKETGTIKIGIILNSPPLGYTDAVTHQPAGFEFELAQDIAKRLNVKAEVVPVNPANRVQFVQQGKVDALLANMQLTPERIKALDFAATSYKEAYGTALVKKGSGITKWEDLKGKPVCLSQGSNYAKPLTEQYGAQTKGLAGVAESLLALKGGNCVASVHDGASLKYLLAENPDWQNYEAPIQDELLPSPSVIWVKKGEKDTANALDGIIKEWHRSGWLVNVVNQHKWSYLAPSLIALQKAELAKSKS